MSDTSSAKSLWTKKVESEPQHSVWFIQRFRDMRAAGKDIAGEARFVDALLPRGARILDAGCGSGRTGGPLAAAGHTVVGVDVDPVLIAAAREDYPDVDWHVGDLAALDLAALGVTEPFDAVVAAGNVMPFLAPSTRREVLTRLRAALKPDGRAALGFGAGRGYPFAEFFADAKATGWLVQATFRGWNLLPFDAESDFLVALLAPAPRLADPRLADPRLTGRRLTDPRLTGRSSRFSAESGNSPAHRTGDDPMGGNSLRPLG